MLMSSVSWELPKGHLFLLTTGVYWSSVVHQGERDVDYEAVYGEGAPYGEFL